MADSPLDTQEVVRLYVDEELTVREIATRFGRSYGKIYNLLRSRVVMRRSNGPGPRTRTREYLKVAAIMQERIVTGDWKPNRKILSQADLVKIFGVRQQVIREAIAHLRQRRYLLTIRNKGTYVRPRQDWESSGTQASE